MCQYRVTTDAKNARTNATAVSKTLGHGGYCSLCWSKPSRDQMSKVKVYLRSNFEVKYSESSARKPEVYGVEHKFGLCRFSVNIFMHIGHSTKVIFILLRKIFTILYDKINHKVFLSCFNEKIKKNFREMKIFLQHQIFSRFLAICYYCESYKSWK
jgi:hypothetical protein